MIREAQLQRRRYWLLSTCGAVAMLLAVRPAVAADITITTPTTYDPLTMSGVGIIVDGSSATLTIEAGDAVTTLLDLRNGATLDNLGSVTRTGTDNRGVVGGSGHINNRDGGQITSQDATAILLYGGGSVSNTGEGSLIKGGFRGVSIQGGEATIENLDGATIESAQSTGVYVDRGGKLTNGVGSTIKAAGTAVYAYGELTVDNYGTLDSADRDGISIESGTVTNSGAGASIKGGESGVFIDGPGEVINKDGARIEAALDGVIMNYGGNVTNKGGSTIDVGRVGIVIWDYGTVTNSGVGTSIITAGGGSAVDFSPYELEGPFELINEDGAIISGGAYGVRYYGEGTLTNRSGGKISGYDHAASFSGYGTVYNSGAGSLLTTTAGDDLYRYTVLFAAGGEIHNTDGAQISVGETDISIGVYFYDPEYENGGSGYTGSVYNGVGSSITGGITAVHSLIDTTVENAGTFEGNVWLLRTAENHVTLHNGSLITGELYIGDNSASSLTLTGTGTQLYSDAVLGPTSFTSKLIKNGTGTWVLDRDLHASIINVDAGQLIVGVQQTGSVLGTVNIGAGATVSGSGYIYGNLLSDGIVAPGNSPGVLNVVGGYVANSGSTLEIEIDPTNMLSDRLNILADDGLDNGLAVIRPGAILDVTRLSNAAYTLGTRYTIISTEDGLFGDSSPPLFDMTGDLDASAFLALEYDYDSHNAYLVVTQTQGLADAATTPNQSAVANALDSLPGDSAPRNLALNAPDADTAGAIFDLLSGEIHASLPQMLLSDDRAATIMADRLRTGRCDAPTGDCLWVSAYGAHQDMTGDNTAAPLSASSGGVLLGRETDLSPDWRAGGFIGATMTQMAASTRASSAETTGVTAGTYAGSHNGPVALRLGTSASALAIATHRDLSALPGIDDADARYGALLAASFAELGVTLPAGPLTFEPFLRLDARAIATSGFTETGNAGLTGGAALHTLGAATLGIHTTLETEIAGIALTADSALGWRQPIGKAASAQLAFDGADSFTATGVRPQGGAIASLDLTASLSDSVDLSLGYDGTFGASPSHAVTAKLAGQF